MVLFDIKMSIFGAELVCVTGGYEVRSRGHVTISRFVPSGTLAFNEVPMGIGMAGRWLMPEASAAVTTTALIFTSVPMVTHPHTCI